MFSLFDGLVADTPGFSSMDLKIIPKKELQNTFVEINKHKNACRYKDCSHIKEQECYIKQMVEEQKILLSRYENYKKFMNEGD